MTTRTLRYRWTSSYYRAGRDDAVRLRIAIVEAVGMTDHVFAYRLLPVNPQTAEAAGTFSHVCSPVDLEEYPAQAPVPGSSPEWFRLPFVDVLVRSTAEAYEFLQFVRTDLARLRDTLMRTDILLPGGEEEA
jgi:hypothetical protein